MQCNQYIKHEAPLSLYRLPHPVYLSSQAQPVSLTCLQ